MIEKSRSTFYLSVDKSFIIELRKQAVVKAWQRINNESYTHYDVLLGSREANPADKKWLRKYYRRISKAKFLALLL